MYSKKDLLKMKKRIEKLEKKYTKRSKNTLKELERLEKISEKRLQSSTIKLNETFDKIMIKQKTKKSNLE